MFNFTFPPLGSWEVPIGEKQPRLVCFSPIGEKQPRLVWKMLRKQSQFLTITPSFFFFPCLSS